MMQRTAVRKVWPSRGSRTAHRVFASWAVVGAAVLASRYMAAVQHCSDVQAFHRAGRERGGRPVVVEERQQLGGVVRRRRVAPGSSTDAFSCTGRRRSSAGSLSPFSSSPPLLPPFFFFTNSSATTPGWASWRRRPGSSARPGHSLPGGAPLSPLSSSFPLSSSSLAVDRGQIPQVAAVDRELRLGIRFIGRR
jgi:hypothetical protein